MNGNIPGGSPEPKESKFIGTGEGSSPLAKVPFQKIDMRTMESDMSSVKASGGGSPSPYTPGSAAPTPRPSQPASSPATGASSFNVADMSAPENIEVGTKSPIMPTAPQKNNKVFLWAIIGIVVVGLIAAAYFFLWPALKGIQEAKEKIAPAEEVTPAEEIVRPPATEEGVATPEVIAVHASFFKTPADVVSELRPEIFSAAGVKAAIQPTSTTVPLLKELVIKTGENQPISFKSFAELFFPTFFTPNVVLNFEPDFTFVSYSNSRGTWLALVAKLKGSSDMSFIQQEMNRFQSEPGIKNLYLTDPGNAFAWKDGKIGGKPASVLEFSTRGNEFAYVWFDRYLVVSSNLEAAAEIGKRLGF